MKLLERWNLYPFLFAAYPVLALLAFNIEEIRPQVALRALILSLLAAIVLFTLLARLLHDRTKAALLTTLVLILFFTYGQVYNEVRQIPEAGGLLGHHYVLAPVWLILFVLIGRWIVRGKSDLRLPTTLLNAMGLLLVVFSLFNLGMYAERTAAASRSAVPEAAQGGLHLTTGAPPPDIYYIILDAYSRDDTLRERYDLDVTPFLDTLKSMGFYVASCSQSNYAQTRLSLASSLNMDYLQALSDELKPGNTSRVRVRELLQDSQVRKLLEAQGYKVAAFTTGFESTEWEDADLYLIPSGSGLGSNPLLGGLSAFEEELLRTSFARVAFDGASRLPAAWQSALNNPRRIHRRRIEYNLEQLARLPKTSGPKFVFAHLVIPHPPYVFGPNGEFIDYDMPDTPGYQNQIIYLNKVMTGLLKTILDESATPPVIVIQGDHGAINAPPALRLNILNAYYLPGGEQRLYPSISPVNTFRLIFNTYFNGQYQQLEDHAYFSSYSQPYDFIEERNTRPECK